VVEFNLGMDTPLTDKNTRCFSFGDPNQAYDAALAHSKSMKCPCGKHPRYFAYNLWRGVKNGEAINEFPSFDPETGEVNHPKVPSQAGPYTNGYPFDFAYYNCKRGRWEGANHGTGTGSMKVIYWPNLGVFSSYYPFNTTVVCVTCAK